MKINNSLRNSLLLVAGLWLSATSCQNDNTTITNRVPLNVGTADITRATDTTWDKNDAIGIFTLTPGTNNVTDAQANRKYVAQAGGANASFSPSAENQTAYYPTNGDAVEVLAYYPYNGQQAMDNGQLPVDVSNQSALAAIDLMTSARVEGDNDNPDVALSFEHRLSKMEVSLSAASGTEINWTSATLTLRGTATKATYNLYTQTLSGAQSVADIAVPLRSTATGMQGTAIVLPTAKGASLQLVVVAGGHEYIATPSDEAYFGEGEVTSFRVTLRREVSGPTAAEVSATIRPWVEGHEEDLEAINFIVSTDPTTGAPEVESFTLYKNYGTDTQEAVDYTYNADVQKWDATPAPYYLEDIKENDMFMAIHTPAADPITGIADVLETAEPVKLTNGVINLAFIHANSQLVFNLIAGTGFTADLTTAKVALHGFGTTAYTATGNSIFIVEKGTLAITGTYKVVITLEGKTYECDFSAKLAGKELVANTSYIFNVTLNPTAVSVGEVVVSDWLTGDSNSGSTQANNITQGSFSFPKGKPGAGEIVISTGTKGQAGYYEAIYVWDGADDTDFVLKTGSQDILWDKLDTSVKHSLTLTFTSDATTPEQDIISQTITDVVWGSKLNFTDLKRKNSLFVVELKAGEGYTDANLTWDKVTLTCNLDNSTGTEFGIAEGKAVVKPQNITTTHQLNLAVGLNNYTLNLSEKFSKFEANKSYTLTVFVHKDKIVIDSVSVEDWEGIAANGDIEY